MQYEWRKNSIADGFCCFHGQPQGLSLRFAFRYVVDDAHIVTKQSVTLSACGESVRRDAEPYGFCRKPCIFSGTLRTAFPTIEFR